MATAVTNPRARDTRPAHAARRRNAQRRRFAAYIAEMERAGLAVVHRDGHIVIDLTRLEAVPS